MEELILNWREGAYKQVLTCRGSGDICKIIISSIFCFKLGWIKPPPSSPGSDVPAAVERS